VAFEGILNIYGGDWFHISQNSPFGPALGGLPVAVGVALAAVHLVGVALAVWGFFRAFRHFFDPSDLISPVLATAIVINVGAYSLSIVSFGLFDTREILAVLPFGAVLAGRMVADSLARARLGRVRLTPVLAGGLAGVLACYLAALGYGAAQSQVPDSMQAVIPWLEAHHLTHGLGTYAESNLITMDSGGRVEIRDVSWRSTGNLPRHFETKSSWDDPRHSYANFILTNSADHWGMDGGPNRLVSMIPRSAIAALHAGPPAHVYYYKTFTIMVWNHNLLENLGSSPGIEPGEIPCMRDCV
jgi:predicted anti-sigma-YlaC factor YlaD